MSDLAPPVEIARQYRVFTETGTTTFTFNPSNRMWTVDLGCGVGGTAQAVAAMLRKTADQLLQLSAKIET